MVSQTCHLQKKKDCAKWGELDGKKLKKKEERKKCVLLT